MIGLQIVGSLKKQQEVGLLTLGSLFSVSLPSTDGEGEEIDT